MSQCLKSGNWGYQDCYSGENVAQRYIRVFYCLSRLFQLALILCQRLANSPKVEPCSDPPPPRQENIKKKKNIHKKRRYMGKFSACLCFISLWYGIPYEISSFSARRLYFAYLAAFFTWVSCLTPKFGAHNRKMNLQKFPGMTKKGQNAFILRFCLKYTLAFLARKIQLNSLRAGQYALLWSAYSGKRSTAS